MKPSRIAALACAAALTAVALSCTATAASAARAGDPAQGPGAGRHVVIVGISGLRWSDVSPTATPALWRLAVAGSIGSFADYAVSPLTCPADAWLTLNSGARAQAPRAASCRPVPVSAPGGAATVPGMPALIRHNAGFGYDPDWGLLASGARCSTAVGPGAALALAGRRGAVAARYLPSAAALSAELLARCPLTVVDLGTMSSAERGMLVQHADAALARIDAELPAGSTLLVIAPGATALPAHLQLAIAAGPGYRHGLLTAASAKRAGLALLTDLTPTVLGWLGHDPPAGLAGAPIGSVPRGALGPAVRALADRDVAEQVWQRTHVWFLACYGVAVLAAFGVAGLAARRRRRSALRGVAVYACSVPVATFLANLAPWSGWPAPALGFYLLVAALTAVTGSAAAGVGFVAGRSREPGCWSSGSGAFGIICLFTVVVLGADVLTGSRLQLEAPFGLGLVAGDRYYGIGNAALGCYGVAALGGAAWLGMAARSRRTSLLAVAAVGALAIGVSGWPGLGAKAGGTIALVPCFALLLLGFAGVRLTWRRVLLVLASGLALLVVFAVAGYLLPGRSDITSFAGDLLHGRGGGLLRRKIGSNIGTLAVSGYSPLVPVLVAAAGLMLARPGWFLAGWFRLPGLAAAFRAVPRLRVVLTVIWLLPVLGWFADDAGVLVPAYALPMAVALCVGCVLSASCQDLGTRYRGTAFAGSSVAGQTPR